MEKIPAWVNNNNFSLWRKELKEKLYRERGGVSDFSGKPLNRQCHMHEGIVSRARCRKSIAWHYLIYHPYNCFLLLPEEHDPNPPSLEWAMEKACSRYGQENVEQWFYGLPWKVVPFRIYRS